MSAQPHIPQCSSGHLMIPANTRYRRDGRPLCRQCASERNARWRAENRPPARTMLDGVPYVCGDGAFDVLAAVVRQAIDDYRYCRNDKPHMAAKDFLICCGIVDPRTGRLDYHGHTPPPTRAPRKPAHAVARRVGEEATND